MLSSALHCVFGVNQSSVNVVRSLETFASYLLPDIIFQQCQQQVPSSALEDCEVGDNVHSSLSLVTFKAIVDHHLAAGGSHLDLAYIKERVVAALELRPWSRAVPHG